MAEIINYGPGERSFEVCCKNCGCTINFKLKELENTLTQGVKQGKCPNCRNNVTIHT